jgi:cytosine/adenosine deaminase-related metal-dependent hydrolase
MPRCSSRGCDADLGSLEPGKLADLALWRLDGLGHADMDDPVAALVFGPPPPLALLLVNGEPVVSDGALVRQSLDEIVQRLSAARGSLLRRAERR